MTTPDPDRFALAEQHLEHAGAADAADDFHEELAHLGHALGISRQTVSDIRRGAKWKETA